MKLERRVEPSLSAVCAASVIVAVQGVKGQKGDRGLRGPPGDPGPSSVYTGNEASLSRGPPGEPGPRGPQVTLSRSLERIVLSYCRLSLLHL